MEIIKAGVAGTLESGDIFVEAAPHAGGTELELDSSVKSLYGRQIEAVIRATAESMGVHDVRITANDKGALDCTIEARVKAALLRAAGRESYAWTTEGRRA